MAKQTRFDKRRNVLKGLAIAAVASTMLPAANAKSTNASAQDAKNNATQSSQAPKIRGSKSVNSISNWVYLQSYGSDFNACNGNSCNLAKPKPKRPKVKS